MAVNSVSRPPAVELADNLRQTAQRRSEQRSQDSAQVARSQEGKRSAQAAGVERQVAERNQARERLNAQQQAERAAIVQQQRQHAEQGSIGGNIDTTA
ncbi:hypothetical protein HSX11_14060 [Oxalobacteraceae bacterium]|nr:hypothetical protein [Oxalobacteraceae bacterium]